MRHSDFHSSFSAPSTLLLTFHSLFCIMHLKSFWVVDFEQMQIISDVLWTKNKIRNPYKRLKLCKPRCIYNSLLFRLIIIKWPIFHKHFKRQRRLKSWLHSFSIIKCQVSFWKEQTPICKLAYFPSVMKSLSWAIYLDFTLPRKFIWKRISALNLKNFPRNLK